MFESGLRTIGTSIDVDGRLLCLKSALRKAFRDSPFNRSQSESTCKYPGKTNHSLLEIFRHTDYVPRGDRYAQDPIH